MATGKIGSPTLDLIRLAHASSLDWSQERLDLHAVHQGSQVQGLLELVPALVADCRSRDWRAAGAWSWRSPARLDADCRIALGLCVSTIRSTTLRSGSISHHP